ncbi:MAG: hypothetical protein PF482_14670 [Desulfobacteraceae bacterium]|nr:hypothetical protein [Desulfobacteraceae bacterium]
MEAVSASMHKQKIFCIGLPKTGTTTLGESLQLLGYQKAPYDNTLIDQVAQRNNSGIKTQIQKYDCFEDWPWPLVFRKVHQILPNGCFILTLRKNEQTWLESIQKHIKRNPNARSKRLRQVFYGSSDPWNDSDHYKQFYLNHKIEVMNYFSNHSNSLLIVCWENGDGWEKLCSFLDKQVPEGIPFPHVNSAKSKEKFSANLKRRLKFLKKQINSLGLR